VLLKVHSASVLGIQAQMIDIEVDLSLRKDNGYHVVGCPTPPSKSGERVRAAVRNCGYEFHPGCIVVNPRRPPSRRKAAAVTSPIALGSRPDAHPPRTASGLVDSR
jgi:magnesium chelatase family protein